MEFSKKFIGNSFVYFLARKFLKLKNRPSRRVNLAMFHIGRCGSTVVAKSLEQNSSICWGHEIFQNIPHNQHLWQNTLSNINNAKALLEARMYRNSCCYYGFDTKGMPEHDLNQECLNMDLENYISILKEEGVSKFVILKRENYIRRTISVLVGRQKAQWHSSEKVSKPTKVHISLDNFNVIYDYHIPLLEHFKEVDEYYQNLERLLENNEVLHLVYEKDIQDNPKISYQKVCDFFGADFEEPEIMMKRTNPFKIEEMVDNYKELKEHLSGTKYEWMLVE